MTDITKEKPRRRWVRIALVLSLGVNLLIFGAAAGAVYKFRHGGMENARVDLGIGPIYRALSPEDRRIIGRRLRDHLHQRPPTREERDADLRNLAAAVVTDPFDAALVRSVFSAQMGRANEAQQAGQEAFLAQIQAASPAQRAEFSARLLEQTGRHPRQSADHN
ncbi:MAG: periplasmic heavy metal sensor [Rhodobacteraceae bacterium]|nr:periplasmic heavy metal sensor [Paracoccaceae bacterium]